jgi:hypothetical protein
MQEIHLTREQLDNVHRHCRREPDGPLARNLAADGDRALTAGPFSVMDKTLVPPSGDKHDFLRMPTYAWPNPDTPDGLPYIIRDGQAGPHIGGPEYDQGRMGEFTKAVSYLAWAFLATGESRYAERAVYLLRVWFLDPATRMNPNLTYSKYTPGDQPPYATGVIATHNWADMVQAIGILAGSEAWTGEMGEGLRQWFTEYLEWLQNSPQGLAEKSSPNNRGTWYDAQLVAFARFTGDDDLAVRVLNESCPARLDHQIAVDGSLPEELRRTNSFGYTLMTLKGWTFLALVGDMLGVDLWHWTSSDGRNLRLALNYVAPYIGRLEAWPHQQIKPARFALAVLIYRAAARAYDDPALLEPLSRVDSESLATSPARLYSVILDHGVGRAER